jgi:hypothetical protein
MLTLLPALALFVQYGMFTASMDYWINNWHVPLAILAYGVVLCSVLSILLTALSAYLQRTAPIAITWSSLFVLLTTLARQLRESTGNDAWNLIDPWRDMRYVGQLAFGTAFESPELLNRSLSAAALLFTLCTLALVALVHRVRAVETVRG